MLSCIRLNRFVETFIRLQFGLGASQVGSANRQFIQYTLISLEVSEEPPYFIQLLWNEK